MLRVSFRRAVCWLVLLVWVLAACESDKQATPDEPPVIDLPQTVLSLDGGLSFNLPDGWTSQIPNPESEWPEIHFSNAPITVDVDSLVHQIGNALEDPSETVEDYDTEQAIDLSNLLLGMVQIMPDKSMAGFLPPEEILTAYTGGLADEIDHSPITTQLIDDQPAARMTLTATVNDSSLSMVLVLVEYPKLYALMQVMAAGTIYDEQQATLDAITRSLHIDAAIAGEPQALPDVELAAWTPIPPADISEVEHHGRISFKLPERWVSLSTGAYDEYLVFSSAELQDALYSHLYGTEIHLPTLLEYLVVPPDGEVMPDKANAVVGRVAVHELDMDDTMDRLMADKTPAEIFDTFSKQQDDWPAFTGLATIEAGGHEGVYSFYTQEGRTAQTDVRVLFGIVKLDGAFGLVNLCFFEDDYPQLAPLLVAVLQSLDFGEESVDVPASPAPSLPPSPSPSPTAQPITPSPAPSATPPLLTPPPGTNQCPRYRVEEGNTPVSIADAYDVPLEKFLNANGLAGSESLQLEIGQEVVIPLGACEP